MLTLKKLLKANKGQKKEIEKVLSERKQAIANLEKLVKLQQSA
ncbi:hypothetical protein CKA15_009 [Listeria phage cka15]|nr:hypothetical protein CKA15_009 [Listeria phage cka15]